MEKAHVVVFSELSPKSKVQYTRFLLDHDVKFVKRASDGKYAANIRLHAANEPMLMRSGGNSAIYAEQEREDQLEEEQERLTEKDESDSRLEGVPQELQQYANLIALVGGRRTSKGDSRRPNGGGVFVKETRLVRLMNEIYDARHDDVSRADNYSSATVGENDGSQVNASKTGPVSNAFSRFIKHYLTNRFGLKKLVEQQAWELIDGLHSVQHRVDVELFTSFLQGKYSESTLQFTLFARATIQLMVSLFAGHQRAMTASAYRPALSKSTPSERKTRKFASTSAVTTPVWLSKTQIETLGQTIFGSKTEDSFLEFMYAMKAFVVSHPTGRTASKLVEANELLFIAAETYQKSSLSCNLPSQDDQDVSTNHNLCEFEADEDEIPGEEALQQESHSVNSAHRKISGRGAGMKKPKQNTTSSLAPVVPVPSSTADYDVQRRLGSLLERMKKRQQQPEE